MDRERKKEAERRRNILTEEKRTDDQDESVSKEKENEKENHGRHAVSRSLSTAQRAKRSKMETQVVNQGSAVSSRWGTLVSLAPRLLFIFFQKHRDGKIAFLTRHSAAPTQSPLRGL